MINIKLRAVVTTPSIYHGCSTHKTLWGLKFTVGEFSAVNMKNGGRRSVRKHREIKGSNKYITLEILLNFDSLEKMRITSSDSKDNLRRLVMWLITSLCINSKASPNQ